MDYETKIYLEKLIEAVDNLNSPDWWIIILTIANIGAFVFVAITQIKLQRQQTKLQAEQNKSQEYEVYKQLYSVIKDINKESDKLINRFYLYFTSSVYREIYKRECDNGFIGWLYNRINELDDRFDNCAIDFEIKLAGDTTDLRHYQTLVNEMMLKTQAMERFEKLQIIVFREEEGVNALMLTYRGEKDALINGICDRVAVEKYKDAIRKDLENYLLVRKQVMERNTLDKIKQRIMPIDTK